MLLFSAAGDFMPQPWQDALCQAVGIPLMPHAPDMRYILLGVGYLQVVIAAFFWVISRDVGRYQPFVVSTIVVFLVGAPVFYLICAVAGMPNWCGIVDATGCALIGGILLALYIWPTNSSNNMKGNVDNPERSGGLSAFQS